MMRVTVDTSRCEGHAMCQGVAPDVFDLDNDGIAVVLLDPIPDALAGQAEAGVRACPVAALTIHTS
jgi:ferredoxin